MAKPELTDKVADQSFAEWIDLMQQFASFPNVYVKYSGLSKGSSRGATISSPVGKTDR
jgi:predicted TIM-barrel fold metal-dependent hydrolase